MVYTWISNRKPLICIHAAIIIFQIGLHHFFKCLEHVLLEHSTQQYEGRYSWWCLLASAWHVFWCWLERVLTWYLAQEYNTICDYSLFCSIILHIFFTVIMHCLCEDACYAIWLLDISMLFSNQSKALVSSLMQLALYLKFSGTSSIVLDISNTPEMSCLSIRCQNKFTFWFYSFIS